MAGRRPGLRQSYPINYKELSDVKIPRIRQSNAARDQERLYPVKVVEEDSERYKVHYVGYSHSFDEWKDEEVVSLEEDALVGGQDSCSTTQRFSLYRELATRIKTSLNSHRKSSPVIRIDMPFDRIEFDGGLRLYGKEKRCVHGVQHYTIARFQDLNCLLGMDWHFRGINANGDFCYVMLNTIEYYLYHHRALKEFKLQLSTEGCHAVLRDNGDMLVFSFVRGDGTPDKFGSDPHIFVN